MACVNYIVSYILIAAFIAYLEVLHQLPFEMYHSYLVPTNSACLFAGYSLLVLLTGSLSIVTLAI